MWTESNKIALIRGWFTAIIKNSLGDALWDMTSLRRGKMEDGTKVGGVTQYSFRAVAGYLPLFALDLVVVAGC